MSNISKDERRHLRLSMGTRNQRRRGTKSKVIKHVSPGKPSPKSRFCHRENNETAPKVRLRELIRQYKAGLINVDGSKKKVAS